MQFNSTTQCDKKIVLQDYIDAADYLGIEPTTIHAVDEVESGGSGFLPDGKIKILFEGHIFHRYTKGIYDQDYPTLSYPIWTKQYYALGTIQSKGDGELERLHQASALDRHAALMSASYGRFQVMGFNHKVCGYDNVEDFVNAMMGDETIHLAAFISYIQHNKLVDSLKNHDWAHLAIRYNGAQYAKNSYDVRLEQAYNKYK